jgi:hypothetical protein
MGAVFDFRARPPQVAASTQAKKRPVRCLFPEDDFPQPFLHLFFFRYGGRRGNAAA